MSIKLLKDLNFAEKINANEAITEAGIEILKNYRAYVYSNPATCGIVNGFVLEASKLGFDTGLMSILESVNKFISENNISWKLASACESIRNNNSTYNYINKLGVEQVEKLLEMNESDVVSYIKAGSLKNIQYIPEFRQVCKEVYKQNISEHRANNYTVTNPISYIFKEDESITFSVLGKAYKLNEGKVEEVSCDNMKFNRINKLLEGFKTDGKNIFVEYQAHRNEKYTFTINEDESLTFEMGNKKETFTEAGKFMEHANMVSKTMMGNEKFRFMNFAAMVNEVFENCSTIVTLDQVKFLNTSNGNQIAIIEGKDNVNLTVFRSMNHEAYSKNYDYVVEAINDVIKLSGVDLRFMFESRINEDMKKLDPEAQAIKEQLEANKEAQFDIRKKKIAMLAEQHKNDPVKIALLNKVAKDLSILENQK